MARWTAAMKMASVLGSQTSQEDAMPVENERKYVLSPGFDAGRLKGWQEVEIRQAYLDDGPRIRQIGADFIFTYKKWAPHAGELVEIETPISREDFELLWPLRMVLRLSETEFSDGIFSWRGFLYFKWRHLELQDELSAVMNGIIKYRTAFTLDKDIQKYLAELRPRLVKRIFAAISNLTNCLSIYDTAYNALVMDRNPAPFRNFLLAGPAHFFELGENLGILSHISSFWRYRMGQFNRMNAMTAEEFADLLTDFEESLSIIEMPEETPENAFPNLP
jgi:hypothetical protein